MKNTDRTVYIISGPTAIGKSDVACELAKAIDGEVVNCDSVQLFRYMDIGSAKPSAETMTSVKHHLFSIVDPDYDMTVAKYRQLAMTVIENIIAREKTPVVVGGTGLYLSSILYNMDFGGEEYREENTERRKELEEMADKLGNEYMHNYLSGIAPEAAERIHPNNIRKIIRAIEAYELGNGIKSMDSLELNTNYNFKFYILNTDREYLYNRINIRVLKLIKAGLIEEVDNLIKMGYLTDGDSIKGIGYKEIYAFRNGELELKDAVELIMKNTRHYAKRQLTWLKKYRDAKWIDIVKNESTTDIVNRILADN